MSDDRPRTDACPCGCGQHLPEPLEHPLELVASAIEEWVERQGLTMAQLKSANRSPRMVEARRRIARYLRGHGWSYPMIGRFIDRDHTTVIHLLEGRPAA